MPATVEIRDHEREAMHRLVLAARALAGMLHEHGVPILVAAQAVEDILSRIDTSTIDKIAAIREEQR